MNDQAAAAAVAVAVENPDPLNDMKDRKYGFRTITDEASGTKSKRPNVEVKIKVPSFEGLVAILQGGGKEAELVFASLENTLDDHIKGLLAENEAITSENFPHDKATWSYIANLPESERKGRGIAKEVWEDFAKSYITAMPALTGKPLEQIKTQANLLVQKLNPLRDVEQARKQRIIPGLKDLLTVYANGAADAENFGEVITYLTKRADALLQVAVEANLEANLGI